jgi:hypothetical protein
MSSSKPSPDALSVIVAMVVANDEEVLHDEHVLRGLASTQYWPLIREVTQVVAQCWRSFDYCCSPEFQRSVEGKSPSYTAMAGRLAATHRAEHERRLEAALGQANAAELARLLPIEQCAKLLGAIRSLSVIGTSTLSSGTS